MDLPKPLKITLISFAFVLLLQVNVWAQIDEIRKKSDENRQEKNENNNPPPRQEENNNSYEEPRYTSPPPQSDYSSDSHESSSSSESSYSSLGSSGCEGCTMFLSGIDNIQKNILTNEKKGGFATSVELLPQIAYGQTGMLTLLPRIRANRGIFSTDLRYCTLSEVLKESGATFSTWDWQILQINLSPNEVVNVRMGTGGVLEKYSGLLFNEHSFGLDMRFHPRMYGSLEGRLAIDYETSVLPRTEAALRLHYSFIHLNPFYVYVTAGAMIQNYYSTVKIWSAQSGFALVLR